MARLLLDELGSRLHDGAKEIEVQPADGKAFTLKELQTHVRGMIEIVSIGNGLCLVINEEGKFDPGCTYNEEATKLLHATGWYDPYDFIVGNALVVEDDKA